MRKLLGYSMICIAIGIIIGMWIPAEVAKFITIGALIILGYHFFIK